MTGSSDSIRALRSLLASEKSPEAKVVELATASLTRANSNHSRNTYLWRDDIWTLAEANRAARIPRSIGGEFGDGRSALWGIPVSVKDCFDLAGSPSSCGTK